MTQLSVEPALSSDLTFLTNEAGKSLRDRFGALLTNDTRFFDCLVGYFFISGFYKLYPALEKVEKIRILVGLKTDRTAYELLERAKEQTELAFKSHAEAKKEIADDVLQELEKSHDSPEIEAGVHKFVGWVRSGKLEIRAHASPNLHAKVYIMTFVEGDRDKGRVITGSSNFTQSGLLDNLEFNVELKNRSDYDFAIVKFNELWEPAVDVSKPYEETVVNRSPYAHFTPYELYLKFLYEYFRGELSDSGSLDQIYFPPNFKKLKYQEEAVLSAKKVLEEYNGVFLSDVVGLGKTYMAAMLASQLSGRTLVIAPPHLLDRGRRGSWPDVFTDFHTPQAHYVSAGNLKGFLDENDVSKFENVFIDESHRFRTENQTYETLAQICVNKRVVLVSATPLNNSPRDILSQVKLFQKGKNSDIPNLRNLEAFFARLHKRLKGLDRQRDRDEYFRIIQENAKATREQLLKYLMIRRTRTEIEKYYGEDMREQGLKFPEVKDPEPLYYQFNKMENEFFEESIHALTQDFKYARYEPLKYYDGPKRESEQREKQAQKNLAKFMKILMVKRLESSFHAFHETLGRFISSYQRMIAEFHRGHVYISKDYINKIFDLLEQDDQEPIEQMLADDKAERLEAKYFAPEFITFLESDLKILQKIARLWDKLRRDPKWTAFRERLQNDKLLKKSKLIIFTESRETAEHLADQIRKDVEPKVIVLSGQSDDAEHHRVMANFDANHPHPKNDFRILVTTEVLAEGVNLHRSNVVINYDIPWNPTRLIQRVGRVNRVDTAFDAIYTYNFFPTKQGNDAIKLKEAAQAKIESFIEMLGADARLLTEDETVKSFDLFAKLTSKKTITGEDGEEESELRYLTEIREVRDKNPDLFARIKRLPKKARSTRVLVPSGERPRSVIPSEARNLALNSGVTQLPALLTYFRQGRLDKFFAAAEGSDTSVERDFFQAAKTLKPEDVSEKRQTIPREFYSLLDKNKGAFEAATSPHLEEAPVRKSGSANDAYIAHRLRARDIRRYQGFTEDDEDFIQQVLRLLSDGMLPRPTTKKVADGIRNERDPLRVLGMLRNSIPRAFLQSAQASGQSSAPKPREVILSSWLLGGK